MIHFSRVLIYVILAVTVLSILGSCGTTPPARFYAITSTMSALPLEADPTGAIVTIGPVQIPEYLDRPQIVTVTGTNELILSEYDLWAGSLKDDINRVLIENVSSFLGGAVSVASWKTPLRNANKVPVSIVRIDALPGKSVTLKAQWTVFAKDSRTPAAFKDATIAEPLTGTDHRSVVAAMSKVVSELSRLVAVSVKQVLDGEKGTDNQH